ncbi:MAG: BrnA antitoxin family protein [bacterium]
MNKIKEIPDFKTDEEEFEFWSTHDFTEYLNYSKAKRGAFPNLKPSTRIISIRLPEYLIKDLKMLANKKDVPYQSLVKIYLAKIVQEELQMEHKPRKNFSSNKN